MFSIQWFQIHHIITFSTIYNKVVGLSGARVSPFHGLVPQLTTNSLLFYIQVLYLLKIVITNVYGFYVRYIDQIGWIAGDGDANVFFLHS